MLKEANLVPWVLHTHIEYVSSQLITNLDSVLGSTTNDGPFQIITRVKTNTALTTKVHVGEA